MFVYSYCYLFRRSNNTVVVLVARIPRGQGKWFFYYPLGFHEYYTVLDDSIPIKEKVGYDGVAVHVYI